MGQGRAPWRGTRQLPWYLDAFPCSACIIVCLWAELSHPGCPDAEQGVSGGMPQQQSTVAAANARLAQRRGAPPAAEKLCQARRLLSSTLYLIGCVYKIGVPEAGRSRVMAEARQPRSAFLTDPYTSRDIFGVCRGRCSAVRRRCSWRGPVGRLVASGSGVVCLPAPQQANLALHAAYLLLAVWRLRQVLEVHSRLHSGGSGAGGWAQAPLPQPNACRPPLLPSSSKSTSTHPPSGPEAP